MASPCEFSTGFPPRRSLLRVCMDKMGVIGKACPGIARRQGPCGFVLRPVLVSYVNTISYELRIAETIPRGRSGISLGVAPTNPQRPCKSQNACETAKLSTCSPQYCTGRIGNLDRGEMGSVPRQGAPASVSQGNEKIFRSARENPRCLPIIPWSATAGPPFRREASRNPSAAARFLDFCPRNGYTTFINRPTGG
jgi:hypothetical protein